MIRFFLIVVLMFMPGIAFAQEAVAVTAPPSTTIGLGGFLDIVLGYVAPVVGSVISALLGWLIVQINRRTGLQIEASHRDALQRALENAAGLVIAKLGEKAKDIRIDVRNAYVVEAVEYVQRAAPDALDKFGIAPEDIAEKIKAKLGVLLAPSVTPVEAVGTAPAPSGGASPR